MFQTRIAMIEDAALIDSHRRAMFAAMGGFRDAVLEEVRQASEPWIARMIRDGKYLGWITVDEGVAIASAGLLILDWPPHPLDPRGKVEATF